MPATLDELARQIEVSAIAGDAVQLDQGQFDFGMVGEAGILLFDEMPPCLVGRFAGDVEVGLLASCTVVGDRGFQLMPDDIAVLVSSRTAPGRLAVGESMGVDAPIRLLGGSHNGD
jgi:hypothetical protein